MNVETGTARPRSFFSGRTQIGFSLQQCCGSMTFVWIRIRGSMPLTNGSCYFCHWPSRYQQQQNFVIKISYAYRFLKVHFHNFSKIKSLKESQNRRNQDFSYYFCMMIEGSGSIPLTNESGFGSGRPKNMWIRIRIRIRKTSLQCSSPINHLRVGGALGVHVHGDQVVGPGLVRHNAGDVHQLLLSSGQEGVSKKV